MAGGPSDAFRRRRRCFAVVSDASGSGRRGGELRCREAMTRDANRRWSARWVSPNRRSSNQSYQIHRDVRSTARRGAARKNSSTAAARPGVRGARNFGFAFLAGMLRFSRQPDRTEWQREERVNRSIDDRGRGHRASRTSAAKSRERKTRDYGRTYIRNPLRLAIFLLCHVPGK
jgi:hypothetical protein